MNNRDPTAPIIQGFDCSGLVNRYSFQCEPFYAEGDNGGTLLDGSTVHDILAAKVRLSWTMNSLSSAQYAALTNALNSGESLDTVNAVFFDPSRNAVRLAKCHVTRPQFQFAFDAGRMMSFAGPVLTLEESAPIDFRFAIAPPTKTSYGLGDPLSLSGFAVTAYDKNNRPSDITAQCDTVPANGESLSRAGNVPVPVRYFGFDIGQFMLSVYPARTVAYGDWWTLYADGLLDIFCVGDMPQRGEAPWASYREQITRAVLRDRVTLISRGAFAGCAALESVAIPDSVTYIAKNAFAACAALKSVIIPGSVEAIEEGAFSDCAALESAIISDGVETIRGRAFANCAALESVTIPQSVGTMGASVFVGCSALRSMTILTYAALWSFSRLANITALTFGGGITEIGGMEGPINHPTLTSVTMLDSVTVIGEYAFGGCSALTSVTIPASVVRIGEASFLDCARLRNAYYAGSAAQWAALEIASGNAPLANATIHYNSAGPS